MARPFRTKTARRGISVARLATVGAAALTVLAMATTGGVASAATPLGGQQGGYVLSGKSTGLNIDLFGTQLTGGSSSAAVSYSYNGTAYTESADASGEGVFLTSSGVDGKA